MLLTAANLTVAEKINLIASLQAEKGAIVQDVISADNSESVEIEFGLNGDDCYMLLSDSYAEMTSLKKFETVVALRSFVESKISCIADGEERPIIQPQPPLEA